MKCFTCEASLGESFVKSRRAKWKHFYLQWSEKLSRNIPTQPAPWNDMFFHRSLWKVFLLLERRQGRKLLNLSSSQTTENELFFTQLNSMIHEWDRHIAHHFSWAVNEVFYRRRDFLVLASTGEKMKNLLMLLTKKLAILPPLRGLVFIILPRFKGFS